MKNLQGDQGAMSNLRLTCIALIIAMTDYQKHPKLRSKISITSKSVLGLRSVTTIVPVRGGAQKAGQGRRWGGVGVTMLGTDN